MYDLEVSHREIFKNGETLTHSLVTRAFDNWSFLIGPVLTIPFLVALLRFGRGTRTLLLLLSVDLFLNLFQLLLYPYHLAPVVPIVFCLIASGSQVIYRELKKVAETRALYFTAVLPAGVLFATALNVFGDQIELPKPSYWEQGFEWHRDARADIVRWLSLRPGKQLVMVRYAKNHPVNQEWVYNGADLKEGKVVWARELKDASDSELLGYYKDRTAWLLEADVSPQRVVPYPEIPKTDRYDGCRPCSDEKITALRECESDVVYTSGRNSLCSTGFQSRAKFQCVRPHDPESAGAAGAGS
jgi:hypothetical protein